MQNENNMNYIFALLKFICVLVISLGCYLSAQYSYAAPEIFLSSSNRTQNNCTDQKIRKLALSPDGKYLAAVVGYDIAHVWDFVTGKLLYTFSEEVSFLEFSRDGKNLVSQNSNVITFREPSTGNVVKVFTFSGLAAHYEQILAFSPDMSRILTVLGDDTQLWEISSGQLIYSLPYSSRIAQFSVDGKYILLSHFQVLLLDSATGSVLHTFDMTAGLPDAQFSSNNQYIFTSSNESESVLWDTKTFRKLLTLHDPFGGLSPDEKYIWTGNNHNDLSIWEVKTGKQLYQFTFSAGGYWFVFSHDGRYLVAYNGAGYKDIIGYDVEFIVLDLITGAQRSLGIDVRPSVFRAISNSQDLLIGTDDGSGSIYLVSFLNGEKIRKFC
jgi:WD40 repeat protein